MRILVTGANGMVGRALCALAAERHEVTGLAHGGLDVTDRPAVRAAVAQARPAVVIHAAAFTDVDGCEGDPDRAFAVNALGTRHVAQAAAAHGAGVLYVSSDYVFDGTASRPYVEFDPVGPRSVYGRSKLAGEHEVRAHAGGRYWIVRSQWIYGHGGRNFVDTMLGLAERGQPLRVVTDQVGCPTWSRDLAAALLVLLDREPGFGTYHCSSGGQCSWFEFAEAIFSASGVRPPSLEPIGSDELGRPAPRPAFSVLRNFALERTIGDPMRDWRAGLAGYLAERSSRLGVES